MSKEATKLLIDFEVRPSPQRVAVMDYLMNTKTHPKADQIWAALAPSMPQLSRATVYNTLATLVDKGVINALDLDASATRYDGMMIPHCHFVCTRCGEIFDMEVENIHDELFSLMPPEGFTLTSTQVIFKGLCQKCNEPHNDN